MPTIIPALRYPDGRAAIDFLCRAFGFEEHAVFEDDGLVGHAELRLGDSYVMLGDERVASVPIPTGPTTIYVVVEDVQAAFERAAAAGAQILEEPVDRDYGSREFAAADPAGNRWSFGTYRPG